MSPYGFIICIFYESNFIITKYHRQLRDKGIVAYGLFPKCVTRLSNICDATLKNNKTIVTRLKMYKYLRLSFLVELFIRSMISWDSCGETCSYVSQLLNLFNMSLITSLLQNTPPGLRRPCSLFWRYHPRPRPNEVILQL